MAQQTITISLHPRLVKAVDDEIRRNPTVTSRSAVIAQRLAPLLPENIAIAISRRERGIEQEEARQ